MGEQVAARSLYGGVAQLGEHLPCKQGVKSSNFSISTLAMSNAQMKGLTQSKFTCGCGRTCNWIVRGTRRNDREAIMSPHCVDC